MTLSAGRADVFIAKYRALMVQWTNKGLLFVSVQLN